MPVSLSAADIRRLFELLNEELRGSGTQAELFVVGGAVMCLAYDARPSTQDVDALFRPSEGVRKAAARVAVRANIRPDWLNDGVKGFLSAQGEFAPFLELDHFPCMMAQPGYLLAMKCLAFRIGAEFHDEDDVRYLLRHLDIGDFGQGDRGDHEVLSAGTLSAKDPVRACRIGAYAVLSGTIASCASVLTLVAPIAAPYGHARSTSSEGGPRA